MCEKKGLAVEPGVPVLSLNVTGLLSLLNFLRKENKPFRFKASRREILYPVEAIALPSGTGLINLRLDAFGSKRWGRISTKRRNNIKARSRLEGFAADGGSGDLNCALVIPGFTSLL